MMHNYLKRHNSEDYISGTRNRKTNNNVFEQRHRLRPDENKI